ncbi:UNVERIFIED_CONTAM: hypothetical protein Scaly_1416800 [Sesamum calycinum]|uniref:Uncharacterized protein n=1 Tax=Sesamum calycinum TaxID=2727403 RepID=A0AAW2PS66_9LAMI
MEFSLSGNALKTFARSITCLARIGNELVFQATPSLVPALCLFSLSLYTLNSSRSAYQSITFKPDFFDVYSVSSAQVQCSVLLKAICSVLRTPIASIDHLSVLLADSDASKVQWTLDCFNGSAAKDGNGGADKQVSAERNQNINEQRTIHRMGMMNISIGNNADGLPSSHEEIYKLTLSAIVLASQSQSNDMGWYINQTYAISQVFVILTKISCHPMETDNPGHPQDINCHGVSQRHPSNWVDADDEDDEGDEAELCVQSTPPYS